MDKKDIEELEKWQREHENNLKEKYGCDITRLSKETQKSTKTIDTITNVTGKIGISLKKLLIIIFSIALIIIMYFLIVYFNSIKSNVSIDAIGTLKSMYGKDLTITSQELDEKGNGTYQVQTTGNDKINFTVVKKYGNFSSDYSSSCLKYFFEKWNSNSKKFFIVDESKEDNGLLKYNLYENINQFDDIDSAVDKYEEFKDFANEYYFEDWGIWIKKGEFKYPMVLGTGYSEDAIRTKLKREYIIINKQRGIALNDVSAANMEKYNKPDTLNIILNQEKLEDEDDIQNCTIMYDDKIQEYTISMKAKILSKINSVQNIKRSGGVIKSFQINDVQYTLSTTKENLDKKIIYYDISMTTFENIFNAKVEYNYNQGTVTITV